MARSNFSFEELIANSTVTASTDVDNGLSTATAAAGVGVVHRAVGIAADYSAAVAAIKTITLKTGGTSRWILRWDFAKGPYVGSVPGIVSSAIAGNEAMTVELAASGTGGTTGRVHLFYTDLPSDTIVAS